MLRFTLQKTALHCALCLSIALQGCSTARGIDPLGHMLDGDGLARGEAIALAAKEAAWPQARWWRVYGDEQLDRWIDMATQASPSLAIAAARLRQAKALAGIAESAESLQINGDAGVRRRQWPDDPFYGPGALSGSQTWDNNLLLSGSYPLDLWGREKNVSEQFLDLAHMTAARQRMAQLDLQGAVVHVYIQLALHYGERDVLQATLSQQRQIHELAVRRRDGGIGTDLETTRTQTPIADTRRRIDLLDEAIALDGNQLAALAGNGPGASTGLRRPDLALHQALALPSTLPAQLLGHRPDVVASRWNVAAQARGVDVAHADFYPNVNLAGSLGYTASGGNVLAFLGANKLNYSVGPALSLPVFDGGRLRSALGQATAGYDEAVARYNQTLILALREISDQLIRRSAVDRQRQLIVESVDSARRTFGLALTAYQRGLTDYLSVLDAQTQLLDQYRIERRNQAASLDAHASLMIALGGGAVQADVPAEDQTLPAQPPALFKALDSLVNPR
ncbi:efflux transporter outer membrane subunit [Pseudomonas gingeri]|uniref:efflux transporter outer membrane subunit n=1 Tax=Pseudomonas gingeri TaxID=117681 RepID=UPI0034E97116